MDVSDVITKAGEVIGVLDDLDHKVNDLGRERPKIDVNLDGIAKAMVELDLLQKKIKDINNTKAKIPVSVAGAAGGADNLIAGNGAGEISKGLGSVFNVTPSLAVAIVGAIIAASPFIASALNAALEGGVGLGGIALGIAGQVDNPVVQAAVARFTSGLKGELAGATRDFAPAISESLALLGVVFEKVINSIDFSGLSKELIFLTEGITGFIQNANLGKIFKDAEPFIEELAKLLPALGKAFSDFMSEIERSNGSMEGMRVIIMLLAGALEILGHLFGSLGNVFDFLVEAGARISHFFEWMTHVGAQVVDVLDSWLKNFSELTMVLGPLTKLLEKLSSFGGEMVKFFDFLKGGTGKAGTDKLDEQINGIAAALTQMGDAIPDVSQKTKDLVGQLDNANTAVQPLTQAFSLLQTTATGLPMVLNTISQVLGTGVSQSAVTAAGSLDTITADLEGKVFSALMGAKQAVIAFKMTFYDLTDAVNQNGTTLDSNTKKGLQNQLAILQMVQANQQLYQANVASGMSATDATAKFNDNAKALEDAAVKAGFHRDQVHSLIAQLDSVPGKTEAEIEMTGLADAIQQLADAITKLAIINGYRADAYFTVHYNQVGDPTAMKGPSWATTHNQAMGGVVRAASGFLAPANPGTLVLAGEPQTNGEWFMPMTGISRQRAMSLMNQAGEAYGLSTAPRGQFVNDYSNKMTVVHEHHIVIDGTGLMRNLRAEIKDQGGDVQKVLGPRRG